MIFDESGQALVALLVSLVGVPPGPAALGCFKGVLASMGAFFDQGAIHLVELIDELLPVGRPIRVGDFHEGL